MRQVALRPMLLALALAAPGVAQAQSAPLAFPADSARVELIERANKSILHFKGVVDAPPRRDPMAGISDKQRERLLKRDPDFFKRMAERPPLEPRRSEGTAFVFDSARGLALTTAHLLAEVTGLTVVTSDGKELQASVVGHDRDTGIGVLRFTGATLPALPIAARTPRAGETALMMGRVIPLHTALASQGMVMGIATDTGPTSPNAPSLTDLVILDNLLAQGGMGGGPVMTMKGEAFAIASMLFGTRGYGQEALTLAVPLPELKEVIAALVRDGAVKRGVIGLDYDCTDPACVVMGVLAGSPSEKGDFKVGDVIRSVDGKPATSWSQLRRHVMSRPPGTRFAFTLERGGKTVMTEVTSVAPEAIKAVGPDELFGPAGAAAGDTP